MSNFFFCHNEFKSRLLQMRRKASVCGKGFITNWNKDHVDMKMLRNTLVRKFKRSEIQGGLKLRRCVFTSHGSFILEEIIYFNSWTEVGYLERIVTRKLTVIGCITPSNSYLQQTTLKTIVQTYGKSLQMNYNYWIQLKTLWHYDHNSAVPRENQHYGLCWCIDSVQPAQSAQTNPDRHIPSQVDRCIDYRVISRLAEAPDLYF